MPRIAEPRWDDDRKRWYANIGEADEKGRARAVRFPREIGQKDKEAAWEFFRQYKASHQAVKVDTADPTVAGLFELYLLALEQRITDGSMTPEHYSVVRTHLSRFADFTPDDDERMPYGDRLARQLTKDSMEDFIAAMQSRYTPHYVDGFTRSTNAAFNWAARKKGRGGGGLLESNPISGFESPTIPRSPERFAERKTAAVFLKFWRKRTLRSKYIGDRRTRFERLTWLLKRCLIHTGARPKELCVLHWEDIDWKNRITTAGHVAAKAMIPPDRWKTGKKTGRFRPILFSAVLTRALWREYNRPDRHPTHVFMHGHGRGGNGQAQPWPDGSRLAQKIRKVRDEAIEAGVPLVGKGPKRLVNYIWRHTAASTLIMEGVDLATVAELLGTSVEMLRQHYSHILDDHLASAADVLTRRRSRRRGASA
jgi:integrase